MDYEVEYRTAASKETIGVPEHAYVALVDALRAVGRDPFDPATSRPTSVVNVRHVVFAQSGLALVFVDTTERRVWVFRIIWAG
ncbi:hypothetical protein [Thermomonospora umbrina]|uniref:Uncharacterized protein n=1 Tax=Thermomonospora umbrina TaxID=111806 RepID=A0A3D9SWP1_9ACTN|nr:hypothetical protein [Thermomonospora umbrina]REF00370.1 hypothetical protein DFJ69_5902 [Thermomonospora umbrina]